MLSGQLAGITYQGNNEGGGTFIIGPL